MHGIIGLGTRCFDGSKGASYHVCSERLLDVRLGRGGGGGGMLISYHTNTHINKMNQVLCMSILMIFNKWSFQVNVLGVIGNGITKHHHFMRVSPLLWFTAFITRTPM